MFIHMFDVYRMALISVDEVSTHGPKDGYSIVWNEVLGDAEGRASLLVLRLDGVHRMNQQAAY